MGDYSLKVVPRAGVTPPGVTPTLVQELADISLKQVSWVANGSGQLTYDIGTIDPRATYSRILQHETQLWKGDTLLWWGAARKRRIGDNITAVTLYDLWSYFARRFVQENLWNGLPDNGTVPVLMEQIAIAWNLINYTQGRPNGNLGITSSSWSPSGVTRAIDYPQDKHGRISDLVYQFTEFEDGFDFAIEIFADGRRVWTPYYPRKGTTHTNLRLEWGKNIKSFDYEEDGDTIATEVIGTGDFGGPAKIEQTYRHQPAVDSLGLFQDVVNFEEVEDEDDLLELAKAQVLARGLRPSEVMTLSCKENYEGANGVLVKEPLIGVINTGDILPVEINRGECQVHGTRRILGVVLNLETDVVDLVTNVG